MAAQQAAGARPQSEAWSLHGDPGGNKAGGE